MEDRRQDGHRTAVRAAQALTRQGLAQQQRVARHAPAHARGVPGLALQQHGQLRAAVPVADEPDQIGEAPLQRAPGRSGRDPFLGQGLDAGQIRLVPRRPGHFQMPERQIPRDDAVTEDGLDALVELIGRGATIGHGLPHGRGASRPRNAGGAA